MVYAGARGLSGQKRQRVEDDVSVLGLGLARVEDGAVGVHQDHGGGEIEEAGGEDEGVVGEVVGLADHEAVDVEVKAARGEDDVGVEGYGHGAQDNQEQNAELQKRMNLQWSPVIRTTTTSRS